MKNMEVVQDMESWRNTDKSVGYVVINTHIDLHGRAIVSFLREIQEDGAYRTTVFTSSLSDACIFEDRDIAKGISENMGDGHTIQRI